MSKKKSASEPRSIRNLVLVLGDQLDEGSSAFDGFDKKRDVVWMAEVSEESTHVWSHKTRTALFLSAMRHFRNRLRQKHFDIDYRELDDEAVSFEEALSDSLGRYRPERLVVCQPGDYRVLQTLKDSAGEHDVSLDIRPDRHFFWGLDEFEEYAAGKKELRLDPFYRKSRNRFDYLMTDSGPVGGKWNFDAQNRKSFGRKGPGRIPEPTEFSPNKTTREVLALVEKRFGDHPGSLDHFDWPVTPEDAEAALEDFVENRLAKFGDYQDAMWTDEPLLYHSRISSAMNLKLLDPRTVLDSVITAYRKKRAPLAAVEGFVRQILGWREYVRGIYWAYMPEYAERNELGASNELPTFYWTGDTEMNCLKHAIGQTLEYGYAHHIQRLMVTGLFSLLLGVLPKAIHEWYLAVYVDAVEWVELPNTLGMSQYADGGVMASKPYVASGNYINKMSNYCKDCPFDPKKATGDDACPFTTLYWRFLEKHASPLEDNSRMTLQLKNVERKSRSERKQIRDKAESIVEDLSG